MERILPETGAQEFGSAVARATEDSTMWTQTAHAAPQKKARCASRISVRNAAGLRGA